MVFADRAQAGKLLAESLKKYVNKNVIVYALPRGGVVIACEVAKKLKAPLDLLIVRKISHPINREYAIGAISENGQTVFNEAETETISQDWIEEEIHNQKTEIERRQLIYRDGKSALPATGKIAIIIDDGIATGLTMKAAIKELKNQNPQKIVVAVPITPPDVAEILKIQSDEFISLEIPKNFLGAVGAYYAYFPQVSDEEVINLIVDSRHF